MDLVSTADFAWFALKPTTPAGRRVVQTNPRHRATTQFEFSWNDLSKTGSGRIVHFGGDTDADVVIPSSPHRYLGSFATTPNGDLLLCDGGSGTVNLFASEKNTTGYLAGFSIKKPGDQCVIPMTKNIFFSVQVADIMFQFIWLMPLDPDSVASYRSRACQFYPYRQQIFTKSTSRMPPQSPETEPTVQYLASGESVVERELKPVIHFRQIALNRARAVHASIDLCTGERVVIKEVDLASLGLTVKPTRIEIEIWAKLQHKHVAKLEHHQSWSGLEGRPVQLFMKLYDGDARLLAQGSTFNKSFSTDCIPRLPNFLMHCLAALSHMHKQGLVHGNVKLQNILHSTEEGQNVPNFYLAGFGATAATVGRTVLPKDRYYTPLEQQSTPERPFWTQAPADIYSFGIAILEFLGVVSGDEFLWSYHNWCQKLKFNGYKGEYQQFSLGDPDDVACSRVESLRATLLKNTVLEAMLNPDPAERPTAAKALEDFSQHYGFKIPTDLDY